MTGFPREMYGYIIIEIFAGQQSMITLYRAMRVSTVEGNRLRSCNHGAILSINSFVSTSLSPTVAAIYLGTDADRDIMLEILIDKNLLDSSCLPFADIHTFSAFPDEEEVLLSMGTTLQVQSVTSNRQNNIYIQARLFYEENPSMKELKAYILEEELRYGQAESYYIDALARLLQSTGDFEKLRQIMKLSKPDNRTAINDVFRFIPEFADSIQNTRDIDNACLHMSRILPKLTELCKDNENNPHLPNSSKHSLSLIAKFLANFPSVPISSENSDNLDAFKPQILSSSFLIEQVMDSLSCPSLHPMRLLIQMIRGMGETLQGRHAQALKCFETGFASSTASLLDNNSPLRQMSMINMAQSVAGLGNGDRSLQILEDLHISSIPQVTTLFELAAHHERRGDLPMAIVCYRNIIDECNLPPNSIDIVYAHYSIASAFEKLEDIELALFNYRRARDLLLQHHPPKHPLFAPLEYLIRSTELLQQMNQMEQRLKTLFDQKEF
jgi:tetratricopeptide (TPR) repeat protein